MTTRPFRAVTRGMGFVTIGIPYATMAYNKGDYKQTGTEQALFDEAFTIVLAHLNIDPQIIFMGRYSQGGYSTTVLGE